MENSVTAPHPVQPDAATPEPVLVAMDGPAGSGKSSVSKEAARRLGFGILDTGAAYRALAATGLRRGIDLDDAEAVRGILDDWAYSITLTGIPRVTVDGLDVTEEIREPRVSAEVSRVARIPAVRETLNEMFRRAVAESGLPGVIIEGRDITTVVAPNAPVRILLTADPAVRAQRRAGELTGSDAAEVLASLTERDAKDAQVVDFLQAAPGVTLVDSTALNFDETVEAVLDVIRTQHTGEQR
ncbi:(d)CMP kinase [Leucobacter sp. M11]|uniref:(d)CMP kinase n=1 Tax=Leucobacter sp. M11 TaxID=2993565 RepID=UPI003FA55656